MTVRNTNLKRLRMSDRRLSFIFSRRSSSFSADTDASASYHRSASAGRLSRRSSLASSNDSDSGAIDPNTHVLAAKAADEKKNSFRESLPQSLHAAHADRDCVAPFRRDEVSGW